MRRGLNLEIEQQIASGVRTSSEIAERLDHSRKSIQAILSAMKVQGRVRKAGHVFHGWGKGYQSIWKIVGRTREAEAS